MIDEWQMLSDFFLTNMDVVYLIYGLVFIFLGVIVFLQLRITEKSEFRLLEILWLLGFFGITHGIHELLDMLIKISGETTYLIIVNAEFLNISYLFLFLFGYQLINISRKKKITMWIPFLIFILVFPIYTYFLLSNIENHYFWEIMSKYFLVYPGSILSAIGFYLYYQSESNKLDKIKVKRYFIITSLFFISYGILGGLVVPEGSFFPASVINNTAFLDMFGVPVQIFRTLNAIGIAWSVWNIMKIFNIEEVSWRKQAEKKIRDQATLLDKAQDAIIVRNMDHRITYWNKSASRLYGFTDQEAIGKNANELLFKEESPALIQARKRVIEGGEWTGDLHQITKEGKEVIVESRWNLIRNDEGAPTSILVINTDVTEKKRLLQDITERKRAEEALRMFRTVLDGAPDGVRILDSDGYIIYSNKATEKIFGFTPEELKGKHASELHPDPEFYRKVIFPAVRETGNWTGELMLKSKEGKEIPVWLNTSLINNSKGEPMYMIGIIRDITYIKEKGNLEKQLLQADKLATIGQLASGVAHEINNPLCNISIYAQMLLKKTEDEAAKNKLTNINDEAIRAANIVKDLLDFARQSEPELVSININREIDKVLNILEPQLSDIKVNTDLQPLPQIKGDSNQIGQVIMNILTNSIQAITENGEILIKTSSKEDNIEISITDNGCGIPEQNISKIFNPFFTTKKPGEGTGLGLAVSFGIIKNHNGSIVVKSEVGKGTTFTIKLPV